jgi:prefoldin subunit 5
MGFQAGIRDRCKWTRYIQFLQRNGKVEAAQELNDILELQDEAQELGSQSPELLEWIEQLQPILNAVESWKNGRGKEKLFQIYWQQYQQQESGV